MCALLATRRGRCRGAVAGSSVAAVGGSGGGSGGCSVAAACIALQALYPGCVGASASCSVAAAWIDLQAVYRRSETPLAHVPVAGAAAKGDAAALRVLFAHLTRVSRAVRKDELRERVGGGAGARVDGPAKKEPGQGLGRSLYKIVFHFKALLYESIIF